MTRVKQLISTLYRKFGDVFWNLGAFGLYFGVQQLLIFPVIADRFSEEVYSQCVLFLTLFNIAVCVFGEELGNTWLVRRQEYEEAGARGDFFPLFAGVLAAVAAAGILLNRWLLHFDAALLCGYGVVLLCGILRYFLTGLLRGYLRFQQVFITNGIYCLFAAVGLLFVRDGVFPLPFLCGEVPAVLFALWAVQRCEKPAFQRTPMLAKTGAHYAKFGFCALLIESTVYLDRLLIYPRLGAVPMSLYVSTATMSKMTSMVANPLSSVLLARFSHVKKEDGSAAVRRMLALWPVGFVGVFALNLVLTPVAMKLLYSQYFDAAKGLILPVALAGGLACANYMIRPAILRFYSSTVFVVLNLVYAAAFLSFIFVFSGVWGLTGYAMATVGARAVQSAGYLLVLFLGIKGKRV